MLDDLPTGAAMAARSMPQSVSAWTAARPWAFIAASLGLLGVALALRFWNLAGAPIWMDEAFTYVAAQLPLKTILFGAIDNHPPLFYALQHLWQALDPRLGHVRVPAAIAGALTVVTVTLAGADLVSRRAGLLAGLFLALSTSQIYFSQDARMYPLLNLGLALAAWGLAGLAQRPERRLPYGVLYVLGGAAAVYTQVVALIFLASLNLALLASLLATRAPRRAYLDWLVANLVLGLVSLPWLLSLSGAMGGFRGLRRYPAALVGWFLATAIGFPAAPGLARKLSLLLLAALLVFGAWRTWREGRAPTAALGLAALLLYPLLLVVVNVATPIFEHRIFTPSAIGAALLFGAGLAGLGSPLLRWPALAAYLAVAVLSLSTEHRTRVKPENAPEALAIADRAGFAGAPVLSCDFFPALTAHAAAPQRPVFFLTPSVRAADGGPREPVRMDDRFGRALAMTMPRLQRAYAADLAPYLGDAADASANTAALRASDRIVVMNAVCSRRWTDPYLRRLGFVKVAAPTVTQPRSVVFSNVWTRPELWRRAEAASPPA